MFGLHHGHTSEGVAIAKEAVATQMKSSPVNALKGLDVYYPGFSTRKPEGIERRIPERARIMKKTSFLSISFLIFSCCIFRTLARADWINLSGAQNAPNIAEIHINDDHVKVELEISVNDLMTFDRLIPMPLIRPAVCPLM